MFDNFKKFFESIYFILLNINDKFNFIRPRKIFKSNSKRL